MGASLWLAVVVISTLVILARLFFCEGAEPRLVGEHLGGVFALLTLVADELHADGLHVVRGEVLLVGHTLRVDAQVEGAQTVELDLVALQEQFLETLDELLHYALHDIGGKDRTVLHHVAAEVTGAHRVMINQTTIGLAVSAVLAVVVLVRFKK